MFKGKLDESFEVIDAIKKCNTIDQLHVLIVKLIQEYGATFVFAGIMPELDSSQKVQQEHVLFGNIPPEWASRYFARSYLDIDPTIIHVRNNLTPLIWDAPRFSNDIVMSEAREFKLIEGITIPHVTLGGVRLGITFAGMNIDTSPEGQTFYWVIGALAISQAIEIVRNNRKSNPVLVVLTPREKECVEWVAEGKTNWEIGIIMQLSQKTVEKHLSNCQKKFNVFNRTMVVVEALRHGILT